MRAPPPTGYIFPGGEFFFGKEVFFVHLDTTVQKWLSRGSEKIYTYIFQAPRTENCAKKRVFSTNLDPRNDQNGQNGSFWPFFGDFSDFLRNEPPAPTSPWAPKVVFGVPGIWSDQKTPSGSRVLGYLGVGGIFTAVKR